MKFKTAFWAKENKIPTILYGKVEEGQRAGGTGITDGILSQVTRSGRGEFYAGKMEEK